MPADPRASRGKMRDVILMLVKDCTSSSLANVAKIPDVILLLSCAVGLKQADKKIKIETRGKEI